MSSDSNMMMMMGRGGMQPGHQSNMQMMMNPSVGPMGNRFQPRMMGSQGMMAGGVGGNNMPGNNFASGGGPSQMMYNQHPQMLQQRQQMGSILLNFIFAENLLDKFLSLELWTNLQPNKQAL
jgi:hypothetical protein